MKAIVNIIKHQLTISEKSAPNKGLNFAMIEKSKPPKSNQRLALKSLQSDTNIIILPADKGNAIVVIDKVEYSNKLAYFIGNGGYC